eukprot:XP_022269156.1 uncharacterized protein LOC106558120 [Canis lupus familiaris]
MLKGGPKRGNRSAIPQGLNEPNHNSGLLTTSFPPELLFPGQLQGLRCADPGSPTSPDGGRLQTKERRGKGKSSHTYGRRPRKRKKEALASLKVNCDCVGPEITSDPAPPCCTDATQLLSMGGDAWRRHVVRQLKCRPCLRAWMRVSDPRQHRAKPLGVVVETNAKNRGSSEEREWDKVNFFPSNLKSTSLVLGSFQVRAIINSCFYSTNILVKISCW